MRHTYCCLTTCLLESYEFLAHVDVCRTSLLTIFAPTLNPKLGTPVVPFCPVYLGVSLLKLNSRKKGTLVIKGLLGNLVNPKPHLVPPKAPFLSSKDHVEHGFLLLSVVLRLSLWLNAGICGFPSFGGVRTKGQQQDEELI